MTNLPYIQPDCLAIPGAGGVALSARVAPLSTCPLDGTPLCGVICSRCHAEAPTSWVRAFVPLAGWQMSMARLARAARFLEDAERERLAADPAERARSALAVLASLHEVVSDEGTATAIRDEARAVLDAVLDAAHGAVETRAGFHADPDGTFAWVDESGIVVLDADLPPQIDGVEAGALFRRP